MFSNLVSYLFGPDKPEEDAKTQITASPAATDGGWMVVNKVEGKTPQTLPNNEDRVDETTPYRMSCSRRRGVKRSQQVQPTGPVKKMGSDIEEKAIEPAKQQPLILKPSLKTYYPSASKNKLTIPFSKRGFARIDKCKNPSLGKGHMVRPVFQPIKSC